MIEYLRVWLTCVWYKITRQNHAETGTEPQAHARVTRAVDGYGIAPKAEISPEISNLDPVTMNAERIKDLYARGLVYAPTEDADRDRMRIFEEDRARRERMAQEFFDQAACPCGGRHYPSADACRWCTCHDPLNVHHLPQGITPGSRLADVYRERHPSTEQIINHWTAYTDLPGTEHTGAEGRAMAEGRKFAESLEGPGITWQCIGPAGLCPEWQRCAEQGHCVEEPHPVAEINGVLRRVDPDDLEYAIRMDTQRERDEIIRSSYRPCSVCGASDHAGVVHDQTMIQNPVRPSGEIVLCQACPHPEHVTGDRRCTGSVPSWELSGGIESCRCGQEDEQP